MHKIQKRYSRSKGSITTKGEASQTAQVKILAVNFGQILLQIACKLITAQRRRKECVFGRETLGSELFDNSLFEGLVIEGARKCKLDGNVVLNALGSRIEESLDLIGEYNIIRWSDATCRERCGR